MAQAKEVFVSDYDGKPFDTLEEAEAYEQACRLRGKLGEYGVAAKMSKAQLTHLDKHLTAFRLFTEHGVIPEAPKARKPRTLKPKVSGPAA